ncbi:MAG: hypothetical protein K0U45_02085 [Alphaproteobacteria bacterium]|nr:hypothetical protein [Alphaproteobacteria bacterium]
MTDNIIYHDMASLLCSRLCHELIGPLGALMGGFDMLAEFGDFTPEENMVLRQSADRLAMRTKFYRLAYGSAGYRLIAPQEVMPLLRDMLAEHQITFAPPNDAVFMDAPEGSLWLVINQAFLAVDILKQNGHAEVRFDGNLDDLAIIFTGNEADIDDAFKLALLGELPNESMTAYNVHAVHNHLVAQKLGYKITCAVEPKQQVSFGLQKL